MEIRVVMMEVDEDKEKNRGMGGCEDISTIAKATEASEGGEE